MPLLSGCAENSIVENVSQSKAFIPGQMKILRPAFGDAKSEYFGFRYLFIPIGATGVNLVAAAEKEAKESVGADGLVNESVEVDWTREDLFIWAEVVHVSGIGITLIGDGSKVADPTPVEPNGDTPTAQTQGTTKSKKLDWWPQ